MSDFAVARQMMVDRQVRTANVTDPLVQSAMLEVKRELFMPEGQEALAYLDLAVSVNAASKGGPARRLLKPLVLGKLLQALEVGENDKVLDVGCATGYSAALLGRFTAAVVALEEDAALAEKARQALAAAAITNVQVVSGPLPQGWQAEAPYDAILVEGGVEVRPDTLFRQLRPGGRLACIFGNGPAARVMLYRSFEGDVSGRPIFDAAAEVLPGFAKPEVFVF